MGIDPGTTTGYAILDLTGKLIETSAVKALTTDQLITKMICHGTALIVGCDKAKVPDAVATFATKVGAKIISPDKDLLVEEKRKLTEQTPCKNTHEMDATASAIFAWKNLEPLFTKINRVLAKQGKTSLEEEVKTIVIKKQISIKTTLSLIEKQKLSQNPTKINQIKNNNPSQQTIPLQKNKNYTDKKKYEQQITGLKQEKHNIYTELQQLKKITRKLHAKNEQLEQNKTTHPELIRKEQTIRTLTNTLKQKDTKITELREQNNKLYQLLSKSKNSVIMPRLKNLGWQEYIHRTQKFPINPQDIIFVDDPYSFSEQTLKELKTKNITIISNKETKTNTLTSIGIAVMNVKDIQVELHPSIAVIKKTDLDNKRKERFWIQDIIQEYRQERSK